MTQDIYDQHKAAFARVEAYIILKDGERVATIAFKFPADDAGRPYAYVHWLGLEMVRGFAAGGGYDKRSAACAAAARKLALTPEARRDDFPILTYDSFRKALSLDDALSWDRCLRDAGFTVLQAV